MYSYVYELFASPEVTALQDAIDTARQLAYDLIGQNTKGIDISIEQEPDNEALKVIITVPEHMDDVTSRMETRGHEPSHSEPTDPIAAEGRLTIPRSLPDKALPTPHHPAEPHRQPAGHGEPEHHPRPARP